MTLMLLAQSDTRYQLSDLEGRPNKWLKVKIDALVNDTNKDKNDA